jgi:hypothetical protein
MDQLTCHDDQMIINIQKKMFLILSDVNIYDVLIQDIEYNMIEENSSKAI